MSFRAELSIDVSCAICLLRCRCQATAGIQRFLGHVDTITLCLCYLNYLRNHRLLLFEQIHVNLTYRYF